MSSIFDKLAFQRWLGVILVALSIGTIFLVAAQTSRLGEVTECQANYNAAYATAIQQRSIAARNERQAMRNLLTIVLDPHISVEEKRAAFPIYIQALDEADRVRDAADLPTHRC
jgi:hypothetical protein